MVLQACAAGRSREQVLLDLILDAAWLLQRSALLTPGFVQCVQAFVEKVTIMPCPVLPDPLMSFSALPGWHFSSSFVGRAGAHLHAGCMAMTEGTA